MSKNITAGLFVEEASKWLSYTGKKSKDKLDTMYENTAGKYNYFAQYFDDLYDKEKSPLNGKKNGCDWCALFILYIACALADSVYDGFDLLCQTWNGKVDNCAAGVKFMWNYFGYYKRQFSEPKVGDIGFVLDDDGDICHVCIVASISGNTITTIDGNWGNQVTTVKRDISKFKGFGRPKYAEEPEPEETDADKIKALEEEVAGLKANIDSLETEIAELSDKAAKFDAIKTIVETLES